MFRKRLKKFTALTVAFCMSLSFAGCGDKGASHNDGRPGPWIGERVSAGYLSDDPTGADAEAEQEKFDQYLDDMFKEDVTESSVGLHYSVIHPENYGIEVPEPTWGEFDFSDEAIEQDLQDLQDGLAELEAYDRSLLTADQKYCYDMIKDQYECALAYDDYAFLQEPFAYTSGLQSNLPITLAEYKLYNKDDVETYLALLELVPELMEKAMELEDIKIEKGLFMNAKSAESVIEQCETFIKDENSNTLLDTFVTRIDKIDSLSAEEKEAYKERNKKIVLEQIYPCYREVIDYFNTHKNDGKNELGLCYLEGGKEYYALLLKSQTGTDKTPEEVIERLDKAIQDEMSKLYSLAMTNYEDYESYFEDMEDFYKGIDPVETIEYFEECFKDRFPEMPEITFTAQDVHPSLQGITSPAFYMTPAMDDYKNNSIYIDPTQLGDSSRLWNTLAHEGVPGHMFQNTYYLDQNPYPYRTISDFEGYSEGWATYVEGMSFEYYTGYPKETYADISLINNNMNLFLSARIEIGVNYEGWTLDEVKNYFEQQGFGSDGAEDIMDYVISEPANYQMYAFGYLEFLDLRDMAETMLGDKFDEKEFHKVLLETGPSKFYQLKRAVLGYILSK